MDHWWITRKEFTRSWRTLKESLRSVNRLISSFNLKSKVQFLDKGGAMTRGEFNLCMKRLRRFFKNYWTEKRAETVWPEVMDLDVSWLIFRVNNMILHGTFKYDLAEAARKESRPGQIQ